METLEETCWTVQDRTWADELPGLPEELSALLAPPVVVCASNVLGAVHRTAGHPEPAAAAGVA